MNEKVHYTLVKSLKNFIYKYIVGYIHIFNINNIKYHFGEDSVRLWVRSARNLAMMGSRLGVVPISWEEHFREE